MRYRVAAVLVFVLASGRAAPAAEGARGLLSPQQRERLLKQFPDADTNQDGLLGDDEARAYWKKLGGGDPRKLLSRLGLAAGAKKSPAAAQGPAPTLTDVAYGPDSANRLDFWKAPSAQPAPLVVFIHGGGFVGGDKSRVGADGTVRQYLDAGVSFAAINYRFRTVAPIQDVLRDCARAIQFIRFKAPEWNVDKTRIAAYGGSAGAGTSLWLAFHDDLADPKNADPVQRESTRLACAGAIACQFSYDILQWEDLFGADARRFQRGDDVPGMYGLKTDAELLEPAGRKIRADCDMRGLISNEDPPVYLNTDRPGGQLTDRGHLLHHPKHAMAIRDRCRELGVEVVADIPALGIQPAGGEPSTLAEFLLEHLHAASAHGG